MKLRKQLAESLVLINVDFNDYVHSLLTIIQINKLLRCIKLQRGLCLVGMHLHLIFSNLTGFQQWREENLIA